MSNQVSQVKSCNTLEKSLSDQALWNEAIADTEQRILTENKALEAAKINISRLQRALQIYKGNRDRGLAWPTMRESSATQN
jgi:hypothetical protein